MNEQYLGPESDREYIKTYLANIRKLDPIEIATLPDPVNLADTNRLTTYIDVDKFQSLARQVIARIEKHYGIKVEAVRPERYYITPPPESDGVGGFHDRRSLGYQYWYQASFVVMLGRMVPKELRTLELLRDFIHDCLHHSTFRSFRRVIRTTGGVDTITPNMYYQVEGATTTKYIYAGSELIATVEGDGVSTSTNYIHSDHLGSTNVVTDESGAVVQVLDYYPFGSERISTGSNITDRHYIGERYDSESELNYLNARYYESARGQFLSQDPVHLAIGNKAELQGITGVPQDAVLADPQLLHSYGYARNNPLRYKDPDGKYLESAFDVAMLAISVNAFRQDPSLSNAGAALLDAGSLALPGIPAVGGLAVRGGKYADDAASLVAKNREAGAAFEQASGYIKNNERIPSLSGSAKYRIPDTYKPGQEIGDMKNVKYLSLNSQMRDLTSFAKQNNLNFTLITNSATKISQPLADVLGQLRTTLKQLDSAVKNLKKKQ